MAAVRIYNRKLLVYEIKPKEGYVIVWMEGMRLVCCYISPNVTVGEYEMKIDEIMQEVGNTGREYVVLGDFHAKPAEWGSPITDTRGMILTDWVGALDLVVLNTGLEPTFVRRGTGTYIDVTMATQEIATKARGWKVLPDYTGTEHQYIEFSITGTKTTNTVRASGTSVGRCGDGNDWKVYEELIKWRVNIMQGQSPTLESLERVFEEAMEGSKIGRQDVNRMPYWWNADIEALRNVCIAMRRRLTRARGRAGINPEVIEEEYRANPYRKKEALERVV
ncbi:uncharacterized protein [Diabrotica undecimpunctata]|uniref:uncharacterized protein n=1 Tax=Diabrotica undecimpunctata TaxID=50387 RepID=UPI003B63AAFB